MRVLAHEIGHGIGLGHTCDPNNGVACTTAMQSNLMYPSCCASAMPLPPAIGPDDLAGIQYIYPMPAGPAARDGHGWRRPARRVGDAVRSRSEQRDGSRTARMAIPTATDPQLGGVRERDASARRREALLRGRRGQQLLRDADRAAESWRDVAARVLLRLQPQSGGEVPYFIDVPAGSRRTVNYRDARRV